MNIAEHKLSLFRQIDGLSDDLLVEVEKLILKLEVKKNKKTKRQVGCMKGFVVYMADDFDAPLEDFKTYMQ
ncbi:DUF2281 domain-containing protein [Methyloprofundus sp.]|uniref:DUF2281 domain-containing protein n=1 Tax=Methyloprofundus sp. TaxID=2020875 RepID=UPI003D0B2CC1